MKVLAVSGYQPIELNIFDPNDERIGFLKKAIEKRLIHFLEEGLQWILISGQMGVELWTAEVILKLKKQFDIRLALVPPFQNQGKRWPEAYQQKFEELKLVADFYQCIYEDEYKGPYQFRARNEWFVQKSDGCLLLMDEEFPGHTKYFYGVAKQQPNYPIYLITPMDVDDVIEEIRMSDPNYWKDYSD